MKASFALIAIGYALIANIRCRASFRWGGCPIVLMERPSSEQALVIGWVTIAMTGNRTKLQHLSQYAIPSRLKPHQDGGDLNNIKFRDS